MKYAIVEETPIAETVERLQDAGRDVWVWGWSDDGRHVLIVDNDNDQVTVAHVESMGSLGRWECSYRHLRQNVGVYVAQFGRD